MVLKSLYYNLKPCVPWFLRMALRRMRAKRILKTCADYWPIEESAARQPGEWPGWPDGKQFAFVLTHDVESQRGLDRVKQLAGLEMDLGFRSSYNFIPEGSYRVTASDREWLVERGFEVGVHDLNHDGKLYSSRADFVRKAERINRYLEDWKAEGFRSGFMLRNLEWIGDLNILYDSSTFDTDPFEPQPDGAGTIFPFWVTRSAATDSRPASTGYSRDDYVELPYTLPQDSTLFLVLRESTAEIWQKKLDWIAGHGGLALVNIHPDYIDFSENRDKKQAYPVSRVREFLEYVSGKYGGAFWNPCAKELASWYSEGRQRKSKASPAADGRLSDPHRADVCARSLRGKRAAVLLYSYYPADPRPRRAAEALADAGMRVDLVCLREDETEPKQEVVNGVNVFRVPVRKKRDNKLTYLVQYGLFLLHSFAFLARRGWSGAYHLVHAHNMPDVLVFAALFPKLLGAGIILDLHDPMPELMASIYNLKPWNWQVRLLKQLERWSIGFADLALTPNVTFRNLFVSRSCRPEKIQIIMNSPEEEIFDPDRVGPGHSGMSRNGEFRVMHHGSIVHRHGIDLLVEAVARVRPKIPGVRLDIYGSHTPFLDVVLDLARKLGVADAVHYHGSMTQTEIARAIQKCDLGVVPNRRSTFTEINFPTRLFEYISMRRPVLAPATRGICDYFTPEQLLMFEPDNVDDLASKILWVWEQPAAAKDIVERGVQVYRENLWSGERVLFLNHAAALAKAG